MSINVCFITARILQKPKKIDQASNYIVNTEIHFPHSKNYFSNIKILAEGKIAENLLELYIPGDYIIIEGELLITGEEILNIIIYIMDIQPASIITD